MQFGIIIQARMGSTRLPGKILKPFWENKSILDIVLDNLHKVRNAKIIVATSTNPNNDQLVEYLTSRGEFVYRGSENDVLNRFICAAEKFEVDSIIRICSDNPFLDYMGIEKLIDTAKQSYADYIGVKVDGIPSIKTHFGFWGEFITLDALKRVAETTANDTPAHEHVTIHVYTHPKDYKCEWIDCPAYIQGRTDIRLTIDTEEDFSNAQQVFNALTKRTENFTLKDIVEYLDQHRELTNSMKNIINKNKK